MTTASPARNRDRDGDRDHASAAAASHEQVKLRLSERFAQETDPGVILRVVAETLGRHLGVSRVGYGEVVPGEDWITIPLDWTDGIATMVGRRPLYRRSTLVPAYEMGRTLVVPDTEAIEVTPEERGSLRETQCRAFVSVPLIHDGAFVALFSANHHEPRDWTPDEVQLIQQTGARTWSALQHARTIARLRQSEDEFRLLAENMPGICWLSSPDGQASWMNRNGEAFYGPLDAASPPEAAIHPDDRTLVAKAWNRAQRTGGAMEARVRLRGPDGAYRTFLTRSAPIRDAAGTVTRWCGIQFDLTEQEARERHAGFFRALSDAIRTETDANAILDIVAAMLREHLGIDRVLYAEAEGRPGSVQLSVTRDPGAQGDRDTRVGTYRFTVGFQPVLDAWQQGLTTLSDDLLADASAQGVDTEEVRRFAAKHGIRAGLDVPLVKGGRLVAVLMAHHGSPRAWTREEKALVEDVAERAWSTLTRARAEAALRRRQTDQAFLIDWSDRIRASGDAGHIMDTTLTMLGQHLGASRVTYATIGIDGGAYTIVAEWGPGEAPVLGYAFPATNLSPTVREAYLRGELLVSDDLPNDERFGLEARRRFGENRVVARIGIPLSRGGEVRAILAVDQSHVRRWTPEEVRLAGEVADRMWSVLERARVEQALKERDHHRALLLDWSDRTRGLATPEAILDVTLERLGRHLGVSRVSFLQTDATERQFTIIAEWANGVASMVGVSFSLDDVSEAMERDWAEGRIVRYDDITADPRIGPELAQAHLAVEVAAFASAPLVQEGRLRSALSIQSATPRVWTDAEIELLSDLAERAWIALDRARATAEVRRRERDRAFLLDWSDRLVGEADAERIADVTLEMLVTHLGTARANLAEGAVTEGRFRIVAEWRRMADRRAPERSVGARNAVSGGVHQDYLDGDVVAVADARTDPRFDAATAEAYAAVDAVAFLGVPMFRDGQVQAVLSVQQAAPRVWQPAEVQLLRDVANRFWLLLDRARTQDALRRSREALYQTEKLSALGSLLAGVSHELNNPLSIVVAQAVMMERQSKGTEVADRAFKIRKAADRCARIVQTFLAMARQKRPERSPTDLNHVVGAALELIEYGLRTDGIALERALDPSLPLIAADGDQIHQIVVNLVINAQQALASAPGERRITVSTVPGPEPLTVVLEVADTGPGVPEAARRRIFEPFYTTKAQGEGTGMGLSFSQGLAEAHGGRLTLVPGGTGATFRLTLPIEEDLTLPAVEPPTLPAPRPKRRALVIDDEGEIAESLADFLALEGYGCEIAVGGPAGKALLARSDWDLIVSDLRMPDLDGPALHAFVVAERPDLAPRMAFTTGDTLGTAAARFLAETQRPVLEKPFTPETVRRFLEQLDAS